MDIMKFRVWHKPSASFVNEVQSLWRNTYVNDGYLSIDTQGCLCYDRFADGMYKVEDHKDYIIQRFTGIKDNNGIEVYEGDFVRCGDSTGQVSWDSYICGFFFGLYPDEMNKSGSYEVVGNVCEGIK